MTSPRTYATANAFRVALEGRLKALAMAEGIDLQRMRRQVAFDRLLCRLFASSDGPWLLKGGYAMELRVKAARTTRDIDLALKRLPSPKAGWDANAGLVLEILREMSQTELPDYFSFVIGEAVQDLEAAPYGGARFPVDSRMAGRLFVEFHVDVSTGDVLREPYEILRSRDWLAFAGIAVVDFTSISPEEQFAEKLHAYSLPREDRENSRVKDLVDLVLLIEQAKLDANRLRTAIKETFKRRRTHAVPAQLQVPPTSWSTPFAGLAAECGIEGKIEVQFDKVDVFLKELSP